MKTYTFILFSLFAFTLPIGCAGLIGDTGGSLVCISTAGDKKLVLYDFNSHTGGLEKKLEIELPGAPGSQFISPDGNRLYVAVRSSNGVAAFDIDHSNGNLKHIATTDIGANAAYVATDRTGKTLLWASYSGGLVGSHRIGKNGAVIKGAVSQLETHRCAHAILVDTANQFAFVPHTCANAVYQFKFDAATGKLTPNDPALVNPAEGLEPRHLAFHPTLPVIYFDDEKGDSVTAYHYDKSAGIVKPFQTTSTLPAGFDGAKNSCADIEITTDGTFVYASNRGHNSVAGFSVNSADGKLTSIGQFKTGDTPRSFNLSPDNNWVIAAGQKSHDLHVYKRNSATGKLTKQTTVTAIGKSPSWVQFIPLK